MEVGWVVYLLPLITVLVAVLLLRFAFLQTAFVISFLASLYTVIYVGYALLLATPMLMNAVPRIERSKSVVASRSLAIPLDAEWQVRSTWCAPRLTLSE
jgi:hypothetical protein